MAGPLDSPDGNWWDNPVNRRETMWLGIAGAWSLGIFGWMSGFTRFGDQNPIGETYEVTPEGFQASFEAYEDDADTTSEGAVMEGRAPTEDERTNVVMPPGESVYVLGRRFDWGGLPFVIETGTEYDFHLGSADVQHGFSIRPEDNLSKHTNLQILPDTEWVVPMTFDEPGTYHVICNEFCGNGHATMHSKFYVTDSENYPEAGGE